MGKREKISSYLHRVYGLMDFLLFTPPPLPIGCSDFVSFNFSFLLRFEHRVFLRFCVNFYKILQTTVAAAATAPYFFNYSLKNRACIKFMVFLFLIFIISFSYFYYFQDYFMCTVLVFHLLKAKYCIKTKNLHIHFPLNKKKKHSS